MRNSLLLLFFSAIGLVAFSQDFSNKGKDFWIAYANHVRMYTMQAGQQDQMSLYITSDVNTTGQVEIPRIGYSESFTVVANQIKVIKIPDAARLDKDTLTNLGIHVTSVRPVVVYAHIYAQNVSGATVCLPTNTLGKEYFSLNYKQESNESPAYSYMLAIATEDNTTIEITPAAKTVRGWLPGTVHTVSMNKGQVYQVLAETDLSGSTIKSVANTGTCKRIAVYSGSGKVFLRSQGCTANSADNLFQQMYPTATWGKKYITVSSRNNTFNDQTNIYRVAKSDPSATVYVDGNLIANTSFINGFYYEFTGTGVHVISSDKPILVAQYFTTESCYNNGTPGDPEMIFLNPLEQTINNVTLYSSQFYLITQHFINIVIKNSGTAISSLTIDGTPMGSAFQPVGLDPSYSYARIPVQVGTHTIASDSGFNAIAYGFGMAESYGYSAGTNLKDLYQFVSVQNEYAIVNFPAGCRNSPLRFAMTFPYQPTQIKWQFGTALNNFGIADTTINSPVYDSSWIVNGRTLYRYKLNRVSTISTTGIYPIKVLANNPTADGCSGEQEIEYDLQVFDRPSAAFVSITNGCISDSVDFQDRTDGQGRPVVKWSWSFDDGGSSNLKNPKHKYALGKTYNVRFSAITDVGCISDTAQTNIVMSNPPIADFNLSAAACVNKLVSFSDLSNGAGSTLVKWTWKFGDGDSTVSNSSNAVSHVYSSVGTYNVSLQVQNVLGCKSVVVAKEIKSNYSPVVNFGTPEVCLSDPFAEFTDSSSITDNTASQFSYNWNFGDPYATAANPNFSNQKNPQHKYIKDGVYNVRLTVTSTNGCVKDSVKQFVVNGAVPQAGFQVNNANILCSNNDVTVVDNSTVDFGSIVRVEIYWDYMNDPTRKTVDENPFLGKTYSYKYPEFGSPASKTFQVRYIAYSGINCISPLVKNITVLASPQLQFDALGGVCQEVTPFQVTGVRELSGISGAGSFSGQGINAAGLFNPSVATPGQHVLRYTYAGSNGCVAYKEQTISVFPTPKLDMGPDRTLLEGGYITLTPKVTGSNLTYLWTPAIGLDNSHAATPKVSLSNDLTYQLTVTSGDGCEASDKVYVKVLKQVKVPNAFSPNNDGINDKWEIQYLDSYPGCTIDVFNRYGQTVFNSVGYERPWDGTFKGTPLPIGTYYWVIHPKNGREPITGSVTIIR